MTTTTTKTLKSSGGDYSLMQTWEAARQADLVAGDLIEQLECYAFDCYDRCNFIGWTTGANNYIRVYAASGQGHSGISRLSGGTGFRINFDGVVLRNSEDYVRFEGIEVYSFNPSFASQAFIQDDVGASSSLRLDNVIFVTEATATAALYLRIAGLTGYMRNCLVLGNAANAGGIAGFDATCSWEISHCTIHGQVATTGIGIDLNNASNITVKNTVVTGFGTCFAKTSGSFTGSNNASSDATAAGFTSSLSSITAANQYLSLTGGSENYHLKTGNSLDGAGTPLAAVPLDIDGETRSASAPSIGWDETATSISAAVGSASGVGTASGYSPGQKLRSDADITVGTWTRQDFSATNLYQSIDESVADASDYIQSAEYPNASVTTIGLSDPTDPVALGDGYVSAEYYKTGTETIGLTLRLLEGTTVIATWTFSNITATLTRVVVPLTQAQIASIGDRTNLRHKWEATAS